MNKNITTILMTTAIALATCGCAMAGTWVNGYYIDGPLCTVCDGMKVIAHAYGTTVCTHCDGTGIEPPEEPVVVANTVVVDTWCPPPRGHHPRPIVHRNLPHHAPRHQAPRHQARPAPRHQTRPAPCPTARPAPRPAARTGGHGTRRR